jgi:hypothetical protein
VNDWMSKFIDGESPNSWVNQRCSLSVYGVSYAIACNGFRLVAVVDPLAIATLPRVGDFAPGIAEKITRMLSQWIAADVPRWRGPLATLRVWLGRADWKKEERCDACDGAKRCECSICEAPHECGRCEGAGVVSIDADSRPGGLKWPGGHLTPLDRNALAQAQALEHMSGEQVTVTAPSAATLDGIRVDGDGWRVVLMPLAELPDPDVDPVLDLVAA